MAVNAQDFLAGIQMRAQKNTATNKVKQASVPDLSIFGIPSKPMTGAAMTAESTVKTESTTKTGAATMPMHDSVDAPCEPQFSFLPQAKAAEGQVYPAKPKNEKVKISSDHKKASGYKKAPTEEESATTIEFLMEKAMEIKRAMDSQSDIAERVSSQHSEFADVFQNAQLTALQSTALQYTPKQDVNRFVSNAELARTISRTGILRVAAYIRVSSDSEDQENSYETQDRYFNDLLQRNTDWTNAGVYSDYGISGTSKEKRTGYQRLLRHCKEGKIDRIICKSISRFARNTSDFMTALDILHDNHVTILFEKENLDTQDAASNFILTTLAAIAQEESRSISSNLRWGNQKRFPKGHIPNVALYGYRFTDEMDTLEGGYQIRQIEIVEEEAEVVRYIFKEVCDGKAYSEIARDLNRKRIPAPNEGKKHKQVKNRSTTKEGIECGWTGAMISRMISSERYCGDVLVQKTYTPDFLTHKSVRNDGSVPQYLVRDHHPAIIDRDTFEHAQVVRQYNSSRCRNRGNQRTRYAFSSRLTCAHCGRYYNVRNAERNPIWFCPTSALNNGKGVCHAEKVYEEQVVRMFRRAIADRFSLLAGPVVDDVTVADIMSGRYGQDEEHLCTMTKRADDFVFQMRSRLLSVQKSDNMERDRSFLKRQIDAQTVTITETEKRIRKLTSQKDMLETRKNLLDDATVTGDEIAAVTGRLETETARFHEAESEKAKLEQRLADLEEYWEKLESDYEERERALEWMETLPEGQQGTVEFLNGLTSDYVRAFALDITVYDPLHYSVHWFDDTRTAVEMYSNVEDYRYTSDYFDGQRMRQRKYKRK